MSPRAELEALFVAALRAVHGGLAVERALTEQRLAGPCVVLAAGKAAGAMLEGALRSLGGQIEAGCAVSKDEPRVRLGPVELVHAGHPLPDERSQAAAERALELAARTPPDRTLLVLLSGGASALWAAPIPGVSLAEKGRLTDGLLRAGVPIDALNVVRRHLSRIKGGGLARVARAPVVTLALSDVEGDRPEVIGSGPTVPDPSSYAHALRVVESAGLKDAVPACWRALLDGASRERAEGAPVSEEPESSFRVVGSLAPALDAALEAGRARGLRCRSLGRRLSGEASTLGRALVVDARSARQEGIELLVAGGEPTVRVRGDGRGGRAQELALAFALAADGDPALSALVSGTDGSDGPTDAAGAYVDATTLSLARSAGLDPEEVLARNDSYALHAATGGRFVTGSTGTNVTDLALIRIDAGRPRPRG